MSDEPTFSTELQDLINKWSKENGSNTPDFVLAAYLVDCLIAFDSAHNAARHWGDVPDLGVTSDDGLLGNNSSDAEDLPL